MKANGEFCFPTETLNETLRSRGNKRTVSRRTSHGVFCYTSQLKSGKICEEIVCFTLAGSQICRGFKEHNLITCKSNAHVVASLTLRTGTNQITGFVEFRPLTS